jgi:hypothetical protein
VYAAVVRNVQKCKVDITKDRVLSGCKTFHKHCNIVTRILAHDGFEWDEHKHRLLSRVCPEI